MRTGACTVQQALTTEAASVLKHALSLAKRRGHAQVTPLHVAATLLSSTSREAATSCLFRRACLKSHPRHPNSHPLQCRALELCFNVSLNRLPTTTPPPSGAPLLPTHPSLSNALIAALKRAQAHQRRGCIEQQQQQQQQHLLAVKVELEQLIISILDDPSVSRVMREAGFSSTCVKNNLEEDSSAAPPSVFFDTHREVIGQSSFWQTTHFLKPPVEQNPLVFSSQKEDLRLVLEVLLGKNKRRNNTVVVGDSVCYTEGLVAELMGRMEKGEVPEELRSAQLIKFQLSSLHLRFMSRSDVEMKVSDLRRKVTSLTSKRGGVIIYVGDLKWASDEEAREMEVSRGGYRAAADHVIAEVGRLLSGLRSCNNGDANSKVWLMATANYQTYMRCQMRQPTLEAQWALQAVAVPSCGLALSLHPPSPSGQDSMVKALPQNPFQMLEPKPFNHKDEQDNLHRNRLNQNHLYPPLLNQSLISKNYAYGSPHPCRSTGAPGFADSNSISFADFMPKSNGGNCNSLAQLRSGNGSWWEKATPKQWLSEVSLESLKRTTTEDVRTTLALGSTLCSDSVTSTDGKREVTVDHRLELCRRLTENVPWQSETIHSIVEALLDHKSGLNKATWLLIQGTDWIGKRRLSRAIADSFCGSVDWLVHVNLGKSENKVEGDAEIIVEALSKDKNCILSIEEIDRADENFLKFLAEGFESGYFKDPIGRVVSSAQAIFVLTTSSPAKFDDDDDAGGNPDAVIKMKLQIDETKQTDTAASEDLKRKAEWDSPTRNKSKNLRTGETIIDLNISFEGLGGDGDREEDTAPSDLTQETDGGDLCIPHGFLGSICARFALDACPGRSHQMCEHFLSKLHRSFEEAGRRWEGGGAGPGGSLCVDPAVAEELAAASGSFLEKLFEKWLREVFQTSLQTIKKGGKVRLCVEGKEGSVSESGFQGSTLPNRIRVD